MDETYKKIVGDRKHLYDETVEYDESNLPEFLKEYIRELKELDEKKDWLGYDLKFDDFEVRIRICLVNGRVSEYDYKKLVAKYGWLYD